MSHERWMALALEDATRGTGAVSPNPRVGCVIVRDNVVVARGWHHAFGQVHAEVDALMKMTMKAQGCTMYVTLEPCCHMGKQPPCVDAIITSGIRTVVIGMIDPFEPVSGKGIQKLRDNGIDVVVGVLEQECQWLNRWFVHYVKAGKSYVVLKIATTIDMRSALQNSDERWISGPDSRVATHAMRGELDAVMIGIGTLIADDPLLTVRSVEGRNPIRIVVDTECAFPLTSKMAETASTIRTIVICSNDPSYLERRSQLAGCGIETYALPSPSGHIDPDEILRLTASLGIASILLEGGPRLARSFIQAQCVHEVVIHIAPFIAGTGPRWFRSMASAHFDLHSASAVGLDVHLRYLLRARQEEL